MDTVYHCEFVALADLLDSYFIRSALFLLHLLWSDLVEAAVGCVCRDMKRNIVAKIFIFYGFALSPLEFLPACPTRALTEQS